MRALALIRFGERVHVSGGIQQCAGPPLRPTSDFPEFLRLRTRGGSPEVSISTQTGLFNRAGRRHIRLLEKTPFPFDGGDHIPPPGFTDSGMNGDAFPGALRLFRKNETLGLRATAAALRAERGSIREEPTGAH